MGRIYRLLLMAAALFVCSAPASAQPLSKYDIVTDGEGKALDFTVGEVVFGPGYIPPQSGWTRMPFAGVNFYQKADSKQLGEDFVVWYRLRFNVQDVGDGPLAFETDHTAERFVLYLNGVDIHRTFATQDDEHFGWNRPHMANLPRQLLRPGLNELLIRVDAVNRADLRLGAARVGSFGSIRKDYDRRFFARIQGTQIINGILFILTGGTLLFWLVRRKEAIFGWLSLVGIVWILRNFHYYLDKPPFETDLFWMLSVQALFILMVVIYGFVATFIDLPNRRRFMAWLAASGLCVMVLGVIDIPAVGGASIALLATLPISLLVFWIFLRHCIAKPGLDSLLMFGAITTAFGFSVHDLGLLARWWDGAEFYLQPYGSVVVYSAFGFALGRRILLALSNEETMNEVLELRVAEATTALQASENARRVLEVSNAVEHERLRLMREIHDGIGSNLVTALAVARNQDGAAPAVNVLRRSISDLKIAIDSLEPVGGDISLILASFRHRIQRDLNEAGIQLRWNVDEVPQFEWLEATNTLHVLRIFQEAFANILTHSGASEIEVHCRAEPLEGRTGVRVDFRDNGKGLDGDGIASGKGVVNMIARAQTIGGLLTVENNSDRPGTHVSLWLPKVRNYDLPACDSRDPTARPEPELLFERALAEAARLDVEGLNAAMLIYRGIISQFPKFAPAYGALVESWLAAADHGQLNDETSYGSARRMAQLALELGPDLPSGHRAMGMLEYWWERAPERAVVHFRRAIEIDHQDAKSHLCFAGALADNGEHAAAQREYAAAAECGLATSPVLKCHLALLKASMGELTAGIADLQAFTVAEPNFALGWNFLGIAQLTQGDFAAYIETLGNSARIRVTSDTQSAYAMCREAVERGGAEEVALTLVKQVLATESDRIRPNIVTAALCASHCRDVVLTRSVLNTALARSECWGASMMRQRILQLWAGKEDIALAISRLAGPKMDPAVRIAI